MSSSAMRGESRQSSRGRLGSTLSGLAVALGCVLFLGGFVWGALVYRPFSVPSDSMRPTVDPGDRMLAQRINGDEVHRGDVVVFYDPEWGNLPMVKRVIGLGGDTVAGDREGRLTVDGSTIAEPYLFSSGLSMTGFSATVPHGRLFLLGDNRNVSDDSRAHLADGFHGTVPASAVTGRVDATVWPTSRFREFSRPASFAALPGGTSQPGPLGLLATGVGAGAVLIFVGAAYGPVAARRARRGAGRRVTAEA